eukprot:scaffold52282_cov60-Phaeocystis_antarctica.AAC.2
MRRAGARGPPRQHCARHANTAPRQHSAAHSPVTGHSCTPARLLPGPLPCRAGDITLILT